MDEDWRNTFEILKLPLGAGPGGGVGRGTPKGPKFFLYKHSHVHIKSKVMKSRIQWCKNFAPGAYLGVTRGHKVGFKVPFLLSPNSF